MRKKVTKWRVLTYGGRYKIQGCKEWWIFGGWNDWGKLVSPGIVEVTYFDTMEAANERIEDLLAKGFYYDSNRKWKVILTKNGRQQNGI